MSYEFDGVSIKNTVTKEYWDCRDPHELEELTKHLNTYHTILTIYNDTIQLNKKLYIKGLEDPQLTHDYRKRLYVKIEALDELVEKIKLIEKNEGLL